MMKSELSLALAADAANPLALELAGTGDARASVAAHPGDWRAWILRADRDGDTAAIEKAARLAPDNASVLERLALAELNAGRTDRALQHAVAAVELTPWRSDVLDALAQIYAASRRCDEAHAVEQRAIDALPDAAPPSAAAELSNRLAVLDRECGLARESVVRQVLFTPVSKGCSLPLPPAHSGGTLIAEFTIREDGSVGGVSVKGAAGRSVLAAVKRHFESCKYEPIVHDGKPRAVRTSAEIKSVRRGRK
jgi:tetratricopeptide (TPR) repeat protein